MNRAQKILDLLNEEDRSKDIEAWIAKAKKSVEEKSKGDTLGFKKSSKFYKVYVDSVDGGKEKAYCFIDTEGNIYKAASWKVPAKGSRGTIDDIDPTKLTSDTGWLYRK